MLEIHVIENKDDPATRVPDGSGDFESGSWNVAIPKAERLVAEGGSFYLHSAKTAPSHWGGTAVGYRVQEQAPSEGKIVFRFRPRADHKDCVTALEGWGQERKYVGFDD